LWHSLLTVPHDLLTVPHALTEGLPNGSNLNGFMETFGQGSCSACFDFRFPFPVAFAAFIDLRWATAT
jgi:hypothetical protein